MSNHDAIRAAQKGSRAFQHWRESADYPPIDLSDADLRGADLRWVNFAGANLERADFRNASLTGAYFGPATFDRMPPYVSSKNVPANLRGARFDKSLLLAATFNYSEIDDASFDGAYLGLANFRYVEFKSNSFARAKLINTSFLGCQMNGITSLSDVEHHGPSHLDFETLLQSDQLSAEFMLKTGIPPFLSTYLPDFRASAQPIMFYSCFLSHATSDKDFCDQLYSRMVESGLRVWYAPEDMKGGKQLFPQITEAIRLYDKLVIVLSENSMVSPWVAQEIQWARKREAQTKLKVLFPISIVPFDRIRAWELFDSETATDLAAEIRSYYIPDFSKPEIFDRSFERLLKDLQATDITDRMTFP